MPNICFKLRHGMQSFSLNKRVFFELINKRGKILYGQNFLRKSIPDIEDLIGKQLNKKIKLSQNEQLLKKLLNEITIMKRKWVRLQGGNQRNKFLEMLENQSINFEFIEECIEISSGTFASLMFNFY